MLDRSPFQKELIERCPNSIEQDYCCHAYSLHVHTYSEILSKHEEIFVDLNANGKFISCPFYQRLISRGLYQHLEMKNINEGDVILYLNSQNHIVHSGCISPEGKIISKWGGRVKNPYNGEIELGKELWMHSYSDVPLMYTAGGEILALFLRRAEGVDNKDVKVELLRFHSDLKNNGKFIE